MKGEQDIMNLGAVFYEVEEMIEKSELMKIISELHDNFLNLDLIVLEANSALIYGFIAKELASDIEYEYDSLKGIIVSLSNDLTKENASHLYPLQITGKTYYFAFIRNASELKDLI